MQTSNGNRDAAYARLTASLCEAMEQFLKDIEASKKIHPGILSAMNDNEALPTRPANWPHDPMTLNEVQFELRLKEHQVVKLRRMWDFPAPAHRGGRLVFSRAEVERWVGMQPNPTNVAIVLRLRRKRVWTCGSSTDNLQRL